MWANPPVFGLILLSIAPFLFGMPLNTLLPDFNQDILGGGPEDLGLLMLAIFSSFVRKMDDEMAPFENPDSAAEAAAV